MALTRQRTKTYVSVNKLANKVARKKNYINAFMITLYLTF